MLAHGRSVGYSLLVSNDEGEGGSGTTISRRHVANQFGQNLPDAKKRVPQSGDQQWGNQEANRELGDMIQEGGRNI